MGLLLGFEVGGGGRDKLAAVTLVRAATCCLAPRHQTTKRAKLLLFEQ